jgi:hypothetical protein
VPPYLGAAEKFVGGVRSRSSVGLFQSRLKIRKGRECGGCGERGEDFFNNNDFSLEKAPSCLFAFCLSDF